MKSVLITLLLTFAAACASAQTAPTFTYQGQFQDNGAPANGMYDIVVQVWDADTGGTLLASAQVLDADIEKGLFSINVPAAPGGTPLFNGSDRWIQIGFRDGAASIFDPFTFVERTLVRHAPQASFALTAQALADPIWAKDSFFDSAFWGDGDSRVGINTNFAFNDATLAVHKDTTGTHGIVVSTTGPEGAPFLDLQTGAGGDPMGSRMRMTYDGSNGTLRVGPIGSDLMTLRNGLGLSVLSGPVTASDFEYSASVDRRVSLSAAAWRAQKDFDFVLLDSLNGGRSYINQSVTLPEEMMMPVSFPDGAAIESVDFHYEVNGAAQLSLGLLRTSHDGSSQVFIGIVFVNSGTGSNPVTMFVPGAGEIVDNGTFSYALIARSADWDGLAVPPVQVGSVILNYRVGAPD